MTKIPSDNTVKIDSSWSLVAEIEFPLDHARLWDFYVHQGLDSRDDSWKSANSILFY